MHILTHEPFFQETQLPAPDPTPAIIEFLDHQTILEYHLTPQGTRIPNPFNPLSQDLDPQNHPSREIVYKTIDTHIRHLHEGPNFTGIYQFVSDVIEFPANQRSLPFQYLTEKEILQKIPYHLAFPLAAQCIYHHFPEGLSILLAALKAGTAQADITKFQTRSGKTLAHLASEMDSLSCLVVLHKASPNSIDLSDYEGNTVAHTAAIYESTQCTHFLIQNAPSLFKRHNYTGVTPASFITKEFTKVLISLEEDTPSDIQDIQPKEPQNHTKTHPRHPLL